MPTWGATGYAWVMGSHSHEVTDAILDKCKPIAGTPADCIEAIEEYRDAGCSHIMLELWGENRLEQIRLFGEKVLPHFKAA